jgi:hypothetical protein
MKFCTYWSESLGWFTLIRCVARNYNNNQVLAAALLVLQSGE